MLHVVSVGIKALLSMKEFKFVNHLKSSNKLLKVSTLVACIREVSHSIPGDGRIFSLFCCVQVGSGRTSLLSSFLGKIKRLELAANNSCLSVAEV
jgi:hypothetical protein